MNPASKKREKPEVSANGKTTSDALKHAFDVAGDRGKDSLKTELGRSGEPVADAVKQMVEPHGNAIVTLHGGQDISDQRITALEGEVDGLRDDVEGIKSSVGTPKDGKDRATVFGMLAKVEEGMGGNGELGEKVKALDGEVLSVRSTLHGVDATLESNAARLNDLGARVGELERTASDGLPEVLIPKVDGKGTITLTPNGTGLSTEAVKGTASYGKFVDSVVAGFAQVLCITTRLGREVAELKRQPMATKPVQAEAPSLQQPVVPQVEEGMLTGVVGPLLEKLFARGQKAYAVVVDAVGTEVARLLPDVVAAKLRERETFADGTEARVAIAEEVRKQIPTQAPQAQPPREVRITQDQLTAVLSSDKGMATLLQALLDERGQALLGPIVKKLFDEGALNVYFQQGGTVTESIKREVAAQFLQNEPAYRIVIAETERVVSARAQILATEKLCEAVDAAVKRHVPKQQIKDPDAVDMAGRLARGMNDAVLEIIGQPHASNRVAWLYDAIATYGEGNVARILGDAAVTVGDLENLGEVARACEMLGECGTGTGMNMALASIRAVLARPDINEAGNEGYKARVTAVLETLKRKIKGSDSEGSGDQS
jgi:hypothetical protein